MKLWAVLFAPGIATFVAAAGQVIAAVFVAGLAPVGVPVRLAMIVTGWYWLALGVAAIAAAAAALVSAALKTGRVAAG